MSQHVQLKAADGHHLDAYVAEPAGTPKAGIVVVQEIFGVNPHIRSVADGFAKDGFLTIAPALFDRAEKKVELDYTPEGIQRGMQIVQRMQLDQTLADVEAAIQYLRQHGSQKVGVVGYCWGGTLAWLSNTRLHPDATVSYYGGGIQNHIHEKPTCPAIFHFGLLDKHIPQTVVQQVKAAHPEFEVFTYEADHGFNCDARASYNKAAAKQARQRTLAHFNRYLATPSR